MNFKLLLASIALLLSAAVPRSGYSNNGIVEFEMPFEHTGYVACLGEEIHVEATVIVRTHLVELPNGSARYVENWFIEGTAEGLDSGMVWYGQGPSPSAFELTSGTGGWNVEVDWVPLDDGPRIIEKQRMRWVADANGVFRVVQEEDLQYHCIGH